MKNLITYESWGKKYTSQDRLNELSVKGAIIKHITGQKVDNGFVFGNYYSFSTIDGKFIASFYKDNGYGFSSNATGIELKHVTQI